MKLLLYEVILVFQWICMAASLVFALFFDKYKTNYPYMRNFYLYSVVAATSAVYSFSRKYLGLVELIKTPTLNNILLLFHFTFLSIFLFKVINSRKWAPIMIITIIFTITAILFCFFTGTMTKPQSNALAFSNLGLVIICFIYYYNLFDTMPNIILVREPIFWIVNGVFFCMCATVPVLAIRYYFLNKISPLLYSTIEVILPFAYGAMHLFFIKAYLCTVRLSKA